MKSLKVMKLLKSVKSVKLALFAFSIGLATTSVAAGKIVKWVDEKGVTHYGNSQPGAATGLGSQTLNAQGIPTKTQANQQNAASIAAEAKRQAELKLILEKQAAADQRLLDSYASEQDLERNYQQNVELLDQQISSTQGDIANRQKSLKKLIASAGESERAGKPVAEQIKMMIVNERAQIETQKTYIATRQAARVTAKTQFDANLKKYREVIARNKK